MRSFARTAAAVLVAGGLGAYIYFVENTREASGPDAPATKKEKVFAALSADRAKVKSITLARRDGTTIVAVKDGEAWNLRQPKQAPADANEISSLLDSLSSLETEEIVSENEANLAPFGLAEPRVTVSLEVDGSPQPVAFSMGDAVPAGSGVFAKTPSSPRVFTIASYLEGAFNKTAFDLRDRALLAVKREAMLRVDVAGPKGFTLSRSDGAAAEWAIERPARTRAARWTVDSFLGLIENLRMDAIEAEDATAKDLARTGLSTPTVKVALTLAGGASAGLEIGKKTEDGKYYARAAGSKLVAKIPTALVEDIEKGARNLRMTRLLDVATYEVAGFDVVGAGASRTFTKSTAKDDSGVETTVWKGTAPAKDAASEKVSDALFAVGGLEAADFIDAPREPKTYGLDVPALRVVLRFEGGKPDDWFEVGLSGTEAFGRRRDDRAILKLDRKKADDLVAAFRGLGA